MLENINKIFCATAPKLRANMDGCPHKHLVLGRSEVKAIALALA